MSEVTGNIVVPHEAWIIEEAVNFSQAAGDLADAAMKLDEANQSGFPSAADEAIQNAIFTIANRVTLILGGTPTPAKTS